MYIRSSSRRLDRDLNWILSNKLLLLYNLEINLLLVIFLIFNYGLVDNIRPI